jgi:hypothetical protein
MEIFHTGQMNAPKTIGVRNQSTGQIVEEIDLHKGKPTQKEVRIEYQRQKRILKVKYQMKVNIYIAKWSCDSCHKENYTTSEVTDIGVMVHCDCNGSAIDLGTTGDTTRLIGGKFIEYYIE